MEDFIGKYNGDQIDSRLDKVKDMIGATASEAGAAGLVPAPAAGKQASFLRGDGVWANGIATEEYVDQKWFNINPLIMELRKHNAPTDITGFINDNYTSWDNFLQICRYKYLYRSYYVPVSVSFDSVDNGIHLVIMQQNGAVHDVNKSYIYIQHFDVYKDDDGTIKGYIVQQIDLGRGDGYRALMDDGTYKSISNEVDITDILIDSENQYKKTITSNDFNNLKQYVLDRKDLYIDLHVVYDELIISSTKTRFVNQTITGDSILLTYFEINSGGGFNPIVGFYEINGSDLTIKKSNYNIA